MTTVRAAAGSRMALAIDRAQSRPWYRSAGIILLLVILAASGIILGVVARSPHTVHTTVATATGPAAVSVKAHPVAATQILAICANVAGIFGALLAGVALWIQVRSKK